MSNPFNPIISTIDFSIFFQPGIYKIVNKKTGKIYYGESQNIAIRFSQHFYQLQSGIHITFDLQKDWQAFEAKDFSWQILEIGPEWANTKKRQTEENKLIQASINSMNNVYNKLPSLFLTQNIPASANSVFVNDKWFASLKEAAMKNNISLKTAAALSEKQEQGWRYENPEIALLKRKKYREVSKKVKVGNNIFDSISAAARYFGIHPRTVKKRIASGNFSEWLWADQDTNKKLMTNLSARKRRVQVDGTIFSSIADAGRFYNVHRETVRIRCLSNSKQFENWFFLSQN